MVSIVAKGTFLKVLHYWSAVVIQIPATGRMIDSQVPSHLIQIGEKMTSIEYLDFARNLALKAGSVIRDGFGKAADVKYKPDGSPVTDIDMRVNQIVYDSIRDHYPMHGLLGEEFDFGTGLEPYRWICDPLDGTIPFILGIPNSLFMIALMKDNDLEIAVAYDPFRNRLYHATRNGGSFCNDSSIRVSNQSIDDGYMVCGADTISFAPAIQKIGGHIVPVAGTGYRAMMIACGNAVGTIKESADFHDIAPAALIVAEAGGCVTGANGSRLVLDKEIKGGIVISNRVAYRQLVEILQVD